MPYLRFRYPVVNAVTIPGIGKSSRVFAATSVAECPRERMMKYEDLWIAIFNPRPELVVYFGLTFVKSFELNKRSSCEPCTEK